ncbi:helix-turn-helix domain-containing protein [Halalkalicoccus jeotgali]|uniref:Transcription regulator n=1 Tax=Halalkalicoccus jeotgali (strain DSM 18796 / CECT 7217 / JCM 14584 / KCTC 4019 / B3) TaxID=795797 RepID=D8J787_HALJB|nr:helix-turn-helix domain-containing protein [Halalkalicoccus jeotgali]ADJ13982.1 transcription regulator [Halalkalicoccus jeotgali B3]ELY33973.1 transcriptional regulator [Halalkalicoccus jeotgali B3]
MANSMGEMLRQDMECEGLLECFHDLKGIDKEVFRLLNETDQPMTVDEIADRIERERSTAYRAVQRLLQVGFIQKEQINYEQGGYYHVYRPRDADEITQEMQRMLNDWYAKMGQLIGEFGKKYAETPERSTPVES